MNGHVSRYTTLRRVLTSHRCLRQTSSAVARDSSAAGTLGMSGGDITGRAGVGLKRPLQSVGGEASCSMSDVAVLPSAGGSACLAASDIISLKRMSASLSKIADISETAEAMADFGAGIRIGA